MQILTISRRQTGVLIPAVLLNLWMLDTGWLNTWWTKLRLSEAMTTPHYIVFFLMISASLAFAASRLDRMPPAERPRTIAVPTLVCAAATAGIPFVSGFQIVALFLLAAASSGFLSAFLAHALLRCVPRREQAMCLAWSGTLSALVHLLVFSMMLPGNDEASLIVKTLLGAAFPPAALAAVKWLPVCREAFSSCEDEPLPAILSVDASAGRPIRQPGAGRNPRILAVLMLILTCFYLSYGMQDFAATAKWLEGGDALVFTRLFMAAGFLLGGLLWEWKYRHMLVTTSFVLLLLGFICMAFEYRGVASFIAFSCVQLSGSLFVMAVRIILLDVAESFRRPVLVVAMGAVLTNVMKQAGILAALVSWLTMGPLAIFAFSLVFVVIGIPFVSMLFDRLGTYRYGEMSVLPVGMEIRLNESTDSDKREDEPGDGGGSARGTGTAPDSEGEATVRNAHPQPDSAGMPAAPGEDAQNRLLAFSRAYALTPREEQVLALSARGLSIAEMAGSLYVSEPTIKHYVRGILQKTGAKNQKQVITLLYLDPADLPQIVAGAGRPSVIK